jgi:glycosidase
MQWSGGPHGGFTTGTPWEALRPDSATVTVAAQENDPGSLLNLHRRLIHLRAENRALAAGELVPLTASSGQVAAYLRREGRRAVLVVANLGTTPVDNVTLASEGSVLRAGEYAAQDLMVHGVAETLRVGANGRVQGYVPVPRLPPLQVGIYELHPSR